jgi:biopolymer transport protein ExbB/TolQ
MTWIAKVVVVVMILMSIWSFYITVERLMTYRRAKKQSLQFAKQVTQYLAQDRLQDAIEASRKYKDSHLARVTRAGLIEFQLVDSKPGGLSGAEVVEAARRAIEREALICYSDLKKGTGSLATIATTAPFTGLFGTVIGIINAFSKLAGGGGMDVVGPGIAEALVNTAVGLFVAIPAAMFFNFFTGVVERFLVDMNDVSSEFVGYVLKEGRAR